MSPRNGRPPSDNPKTTNLHIRLTEDEKSKIEYCSRVLGLSKTEIIKIGVDEVYKKALEKK